MFIIAGEKSGDNLGAKLISQIRVLKPEVMIHGIGGLRMEGVGLQSIFPMAQINLMGFLEILPHIFRLKKLINQTVDDIIKFTPDVLVTIDSPGFNFRVVKELRKRNLKTKYVHYVAPTVWAYKPERAAKTAKLYDLLLSIIPWEKPYFKKEGLKTEFIGHPLFEDISLLSYDKKIKYRSELGLNNNAKIISIMPGSRIGEIKKHKNILIETINKLLTEYRNIKFFILPTRENEQFVRSEFANLQEVSFISDEVEKQKLLQISDFAFVKSGTVALEVAALGVPHLIFYKINPLSYWLIRRMIKIKYANLINISADREIIPELIQEKFTAKNMYDKCSEIMNDGFGKQIKEMQDELEKFTVKNAEKTSSQTAAELICG